MTASQVAMTAYRPSGDHATSPRRPGKYALSPSMTYDEILKVLTTGVAVGGSEEEGRDASKIGDTGTVATEAPTTESTTETTEAQEGGEGDRMVESD